jgi:hypothetical protein
VDSLREFAELQQTINPFEIYETVSSTGKKKSQSLLGGHFAGRVGGGRFGAGADE